jgi:hypothetical protein
VKGLFSCAASHDVCKEPRSAGGGSNQPEFLLLKGRSLVTFEAGGPVHIWDKRGGLA